MTQVSAGHLGVSWTVSHLLIPDDGRLPGRRRLPTAVVGD